MSGAIACYRNPVIDADFPDPTILSSPVAGWWGGPWARRPMPYDRLEWVDGWPRVAGGPTPSTGERPGPEAGLK